MSARVINLSCEVFFLYECLHAGELQYKATEENPEYLSDVMSPKLHRVQTAMKVIGKNENPSHQEIYERAVLTHPSLSE